MATPVNRPSSDSVFSIERDEMKERVTDKLQRRQEERMAKLEERKLKRESATGKQENADYFRNTFAKEMTAIENRLATADTVEKSALPDFFDGLIVAIQKLLQFVTDSMLSLTSYEIRKFQDDVYQLHADMVERRDELIPKKKFTFKGRQKKSDKPKEVEKPGAAVEEVDGPTNITTDLLRFQCGFVDLSDSDLALQSEEIQAKDIGLTNLKSCSVKLFGSPNAIHMNNLTNCKIFSGPVPGSIFVDNCQDCTIVVSCQQLRVHHTTSTQFYLHVTSRAIIEDTSDVGFAPYNWSYDGQEDDFQTSQLDRSRNSWDDVDDFNWLASDKASPNWSVIPPEKRVVSW
ncbi:tubulin-specific chaperone C-like [Acanthaster planci]|uniref:Tubulin-specific chaperone C-like n=1 Tax=Acanthaster planci TaxID=133434 RepID=A0A8B7XNN4_ACAPL|nr:tubulin-specific chaperone C-like [Acanthaster planci]